MYTIRMLNITKLYVVILNVKIQIQKHPQSKAIEGVYDSI